MHLPRRTALALSATALATQARAQPATPDTITIRIARDLRNLDPANRTSAIEANIAKACMSRLIRPRRGTFETELDAAATFDKPDPTTIRFTLKPGLTFTGVPGGPGGPGTPAVDFGPLTADDVKFSYERFATAGPEGKQAIRAKDWSALDRVEVTGPLSGTIHLKTPAPNILDETLPGTSGCIVSRRAFDALGAARMAQTVVGSGPYLLAAWEPGRRTVLQARPGTQAGDPPPGFATIVLRPIEDPKTAELALRANEVDFTALDPGSIAAIQAAGLRVVQLDSINYVWLGMNVEATPLADIRVRRAIRLAIDPAQVVLGAWNGKAKPIRSILAPGLLGHWPDAPTYPHDVAAARVLLNEAGVKPGTPIRLTLLATPAYQAAALIIRAMLAEAGLDVQIDARPPATFWSSGEGDGGKTLQLSLQRFGGEPDPAFEMQWFLAPQIGAWNWERWNNPEFDRLDAQARSTDDEAARARDYVRMQQLMDESAAFIWLTNEVNAYGVAKFLDPAILPTGDDLQFPLFRPT